MKLILDIDTVDGSQQRVWMNLSELLRVGRSSSADVSVSVDSQLADIHFMIEGAADGWCMQAAPGARVGVNGLISQRCPLKDGDRIVAGQTEFQVTIEVPTTTLPGRESETLERSLKHRVCATYTESSCASGVVQFAIKLNDTSLSELLTSLAGSDNRLWCVVNEKRLGGVVQGIEKQTDDLFTQAPSEIRDTDSLFLASFPIDDQVVENLQSAARADGAMLLTCEQPLPVILEQQRIAWAWYARPSVLKQQLIIGSSQLATKLLASNQMAVLLSAVGCDVLVFARADECEALRGRLATLS